FHEERHQPQFDLVSGLKRLPVLLSERRDGRHVDLVECRQQRRGFLSLNKTFRNPAADRSHWDDLLFAVRGSTRWGLNFGLLLRYRRSFSTAARSRACASRFNAVRFSACVSRIRAVIDRPYSFSAVRLHVPDNVTDGCFLALAL